MRRRTQSESDWAGFMEEGFSFMHPPEDDSPDGAAEDLGSGS